MFNEKSINELKKIKTKPFKRSFKQRPPFKFAEEMDEHTIAVMQDVKRQMKEEIGDEEENPISGKDRNALMQKYGLARITPMDVKSIRKLI